MSNLNIPTNCSSVGFSSRVVVSDMEDTLLSSGDWTTVGVCFFVIWSCWPLGVSNVVVLGTSRDGLGDLGAGVSKG